MTEAIYQSDIIQFDKDIFINPRLYTTAKSNQRLRNISINIDVSSLELGIYCFYHLSWDIENNGIGLVDSSQTNEYECYIVYSNVYIGKKLLLCKCEVPQIMYRKYKYL